MITIVEFKTAALIVGEQRRLLLAGDGPFAVSTSCFVQNPPPPGFRPCAECSTSTVVENEAFTIEAGVDFWKGKTGRIDIAIKDSVGETLHLQVVVLPEPEIAPRAMSA